MSEWGESDADERALEPGRLLEPAVGRQHQRPGQERPCCQRGAGRLEGSDVGQDHQAGQRRVVLTEGTADGHPVADRQVQVVGRGRPEGELVVARGQPAVDHREVGGDVLEAGTTGDRRHRLGHA